MTTPENKVKTKVKALLTKRGAYFFMPATGGYGRSGVPDIVGCYRGAFFAFECKAGDNKPTELQKRELDRIHQNMGYIAVINENNTEQVNAILDCIDAGIGEFVDEFDDDFDEENY